MKSRINTSNFQLMRQDLYPWLSLSYFPVSRWVPLLRHSLSHVRCYNRLCLHRLSCLNWLLSVFCTKCEEYLQSFWTTLHHQNLLFHYFPNFPVDSFLSNSRLNNQVQPILDGHHTIPYHAHTKIDTMLLSSWHTLHQSFRVGIPKIPAYPFRAQTLVSASIRYN